MFGKFMLYVLMFAFGMVLGVAGITIFMYPYWVLITIFFVYGILNRMVGQDEVKAIRK